MRKPASTLESVLPREPDRLTVVICPNCDNPENLGAIIRIGSAFGIDALLLGRSCCDPFSRRVLRVSMGTAFRLPIVVSPDLERDVRRLREEWSLDLVGTVLDDAAEPLSTARRSRHVGLLFGNEADGLDQAWQQMCDRRLTIPMRLGTDSLNVAVAAGIFLHHFTQ
jgi:tRNA G18 (ribose-2'-O)-methylase SpoU